MNIDKTPYYKSIVSKRLAKLNTNLNFDGEELTELSESETGEIVSNVIIEYGKHLRRVNSLLNKVSELKKSDEAYMSKLPLEYTACLLYTSPSPRDRQKSRMPSSA